MPAVSGAQARVSGVEGRYELALVLRGTTRGLVIRFEQAGYHAQQVQLDETDWRGVGSLALDVAMEPVEVRAAFATGAPYGRRPERSKPTPPRFFRICASRSARGILIGCPLLLAESPHRPA